MGRSSEASTLAQLVEEHVLVTLVGSPGVGKTRLALEHAAPLLRSGAAVCFCDLGDAAGVRDIDSAMAAALGRSGGAAEVTPDEVVSLLASLERPLVILDNAETVASAVAEAVSSWLGAGVGTRFLVTSQRRIGVRGECLLELTPLPEEDAVELFLDRMRLVRPQRDPLTNDRAIIKALVNELDCLPLAIELLAARTRVLSPTQLLEHVGDRLKLLSGPAAGERQNGTMRASLTRAWQQLAPWEQAALAQCSVFRGRFTLEAACAVLDLTAHPGARGALDEMHALVDRSLVSSIAAAAAPGDSYDYSLYACVREFAAERLDEVADATAVHARHAAHYLGRAERAAVRSERSDDQIAWDVLDRYAENLLAIHERAVTGPSTVESASLALRAALCLDPVLARRGPLTLRRGLLDRALALSDRMEVATDLRIRALEARGQTAGALGQPDACSHDLKAARALAEQAGDPLLLGRVCTSVGRELIWRGDLGAARSELERALELVRETGGPLEAGGVLGLLATVDLHEGRLLEAQVRAESVLALSRRTSARSLEGEAFRALGVLEAHRGNLAAARAWLERALVAASELHDRRNEASIQVWLGLVSLEQGEPIRARDAFDGGVAVAREIADRRLEATVRLHQVGCLEMTGCRAHADAGHEAVVAALRSAGARGWQALALGRWAAFLADAGRVAEAATALDQADEMLAELADCALGLTVWVDRGHLDLAQARAAASAGDVERVQAFRAEACRRLDDAGGTAALASSPEPSSAPLAERSWHVRRALGCLRAAIARDAPPVETLAVRAGWPSSSSGVAPTKSAGSSTTWPFVVDPDGRWFAVGRRRVNLQRRPVLARLLERLLVARRQAPGEPVDLCGLIRAGWPHELLPRQLAANRVYAAIASLRRLGLRDVLENRSGGYLLDPAHPVCVSDVMAPHRSEGADG